MSAEILRDAAKVLRERAEKATPGPWSPEPEWDRSVWSESLDDADVVEMGTAGSVHDLRYIATMHPGVGLALADWLAEEADAIDDWDPDGGALDAYLAQAAVMRVARTILGGTA